MADPPGPPQVRRQLVLEYLISVDLGFDTKLEEGGEAFNLLEERIKC